MGYSRKKQTGAEGEGVGDMELPAVRTLYQSSNNYSHGGIVTRSIKFYFSFEGDSYRFRKRN